MGGLVYHDVTERKWALKGLEGGVDGLIAVNRRAGGHAGAKGARELLDEMGDLVGGEGGPDRGAGLARRCTVHLAYRGAQAEPEAALSTKELHETALGNPVVQAAVQIFGGEVKEVKSRARKERS